MRIAIPVEEGRLHGNFGRCRRFAVVEVDAENKLVLRSDNMSAPEGPSGLVPRWLRKQGVAVLIAGGIGPRALGICARCGIEVRGSTAGAPVGEVVSAYLGGDLVVPVYKPRPDNYPM